MYHLMEHKKTFYWLCSVLVGLIMLAACAQDVSPQADQQQIIALEDCTLSVPGMAGQIRGRCGQLTVPEDRGHPDGRQINLNIAVIPAASQNPNPDPVFLLAGGPGQAATQVFVPLLSLFNQLNFRRDIVLVDQRGTGRSNPLLCAEMDETEIGLIGEDISIEEHQEQLRACLEQLNADPRHYTTRSAAADLDDIRQSLGYEQINLLGISYGTRLAQIYLQQYPDRVRSMVLNGVVPQGWAIAGQTMAADSERALSLIFQRCRDDDACDQAFPELEEKFRNLLIRLDENPTELSLLHPLTGRSIDMRVSRDMVASIVRLMTYSEDYAALLPYLLYTAEVDDNLHPLVSQYFINLEATAETLSTGLLLSVLCSEDVPLYPTERTVGLEYFQAPMDLYQGMCEVWPHEVVDPEAHQPVMSNVPTLMLSGEADPVTPPANALRAAEYLTNSLNLVAPGLGHNVIHQGCVPRIIYQFIDLGKTDNLAVDCVQQLLPFPFFTSPIGPQP